MCTSEGIHVRVDQGDHPQQHVHPSHLHMCCLELDSWSLYISGETVWNCRWLTAERCDLEGTIKPWNLLHAPATYNFILHFVLHDIFGRVKVWERNIVDQKQSYYLLGKTYIVLLCHIPEKCVATEKKNVRFQVLTVVLLRIQVFFKMSGSCHPVTVSHPRRPKSSTSFLMACMFWCLSLNKLVLLCLLYIHLCTSVLEKSITFQSDVVL